MARAEDPLDCAGWPGRAGTAPAIAATATTRAASAEAQGPPVTSLSGNGFQIKKLHAVRDVHLIAPDRRMTGRDKLDADFIEAEPVAVAASETKSSNAAQPDQAAQAPAHPAASPGQEAKPGAARDRSPARSPARSPSRSQKPNRR